MIGAGRQIHREEFPGSQGRNGEDFQDRFERFYQDLDPTRDLLG